MQLAVKVKPVFYNCKRDLVSVSLGPTVGGFLLVSLKEGRSVCPSVTGMKVWPLYLSDLIKKA